MALEVINPGIATSLQDCGRYGFQQIGVPVCGAMDRYSHQLANALAGNQQDRATLEITLSGPTLRFTRRVVIAICGADLSPLLDQQPINMQQAIKVAAGSVLSFGRRLRGARAYLAVSGGFAVKPQMNSQSTCLGAQFGGADGRYLQKGDRLAINSCFHNAPPRVLPFGAPEVLSTQQPIRVVVGRHWQAFSQQTQQQFLQSAYQIGKDSNRMGYRLQGEALLTEQGGDILSEAVDSGTIQIPPDGQPIVLMADSQTTGGYPKIANVASVDLSRLAQMLPGDSVRFSLISLEQAQRLAFERDNWLQKLFL